MNNIPFDISLVQFEGRYDNIEYRTTTLYFIAPKEWLGDRYPKAAHSEISIEFPIDKPEARFATAMMSPTRLTNDGGGEDYDWFDIDFDNAVMEALMLMAEKKAI